MASDEREVIATRRARAIKTGDPKAVRDHLDTHKAAAPGPTNIDARSITLNLPAPLSVDEYAKLLGKTGGRLIGG